MRTLDWKEICASKKYLDKEDLMNVSYSDYNLLYRKMMTQTTKDNVHILSMNYTIETGELKIKRRYFK